tara:strand:+ start:11844 stop:13133 length:1290 start_codon:yes stop_codon:yes gene_type:complete
MKKAIACYMPNSKLGYRDLKNSNIIGSLKERFNVKSIFSDIEETSLFGNDVKNIITNNNNLRFHLWSIFFELSNFKYYREKIGASQAFPLLGMSFYKRIIIRIIIKLNLISFFSFLLRNILIISSPRYDDDLLGSDFLLAFTSSKDLIFDDLIRCANRNKIRVGLVLINWDNASSKPYLEKPDIVFTWGIQTANLSKSIHGITSKEIGSPRFNVYKNTKYIDKQMLKHRYNLNDNHDYILYAGASFPSNDVKVLNQLSKIITDKYESKYRIIYRPHPHAWFKNESEKNEYYNRIVIDDPIKDQSENIFEKFRDLHQLSCALISPYSTMAVESLINGNPILLIGVDYNKFFRWEHNSKIAPHLKILKNKHSVIHCHSLDNIDSLFEKLIRLSKEKNTNIKSKEISEEIVLMTKKSYENILCDNLENFINN